MMTWAGQVEQARREAAERADAFQPVFSPNGRLSFDQAFFSEDKNQLDNGSILRSGRVGGKLQFLPEWTAATNITFNEGEFAIDDAWVQYGHREFALKVGQFKEPQGLEAQASLLHLPFMERALPFALCSFRKIGAGIERFRPLYSFSAGLFSGRLDHGEGEPGYSVSGRATLAPRFDRDGLVHLGLGLTRRTADSDTAGLKTLRVSTVPETRVDGTRFLNAGRIESVDDHWTVAGEVAVRWRRARLSGEYWRTEVHRSAGLSEPVFEGAYLAADFVLFGRQREYDENRAAFSGIGLSGDRGALELAIRGSWLDLNALESGVTGGQARQYSFAVNWNVNRFVRWMTSLTIVNHDHFADADGRVAADDDLSFIQTRLQISY